MNGPLDRNEAIHKNENWGAVPSVSQAYPRLFETPTMAFLYVLFVYFLEQLCTFYVASSRCTTTKQLAFALSIKSALTMACVGVYANVEWFSSGRNLDVYEREISHRAIEHALAFFSSYLLADMAIGSVRYPSFLHSLTGYPHHIMYLIANTLALYSGMAHVYLLHFIEEIPTVILSIGSFHAHLRHDAAFGLTFFVFRVLYHAYLAWHFVTSSATYAVCAVLTLSVHVYWFKGWVTKYSGLLSRN